MCIHSPLDMAFLDEVQSMQTLHSSPRGLVLGTPQLAAAYVLTQEINVSKESCVHPSVNSFLARILPRSCLGKISQRICF